jgi:crotonobetainyl-CoA:carnitine CoA-transferase CaiB-like acyl-CoA transferase
MLSEVLRTDTADHWAAVLSAKGIPCTRVNKVDQVLSDPQVVANRMIAEFDVDQIGPVRMAGPPVHYSETPGAVSLPPPRLGEHTRSILGGLGFDDAGIERLAADGVVGLDSA